MKLNVSLALYLISTIGLSNFYLKTQNMSTEIKAKKTLKT